MPAKPLSYHAPVSRVPALAPCGYLLSGHESGESRPAAFCCLPIGVRDAIGWVTHDDACAECGDGLELAGPPRACYRSS